MKKIILITILIVSFASLYASILDFACDEFMLLSFAGIFGIILFLILTEKK